MRQQPQPWHLVAVSLLCFSRHPPAPLPVLLPALLHVPEPQCQKMGLTGARTPSHIMTGGLGFPPAAWELGASAVARAGVLLWAGLCPPAGSPCTCCRSLSCMEQLLTHVGGPSKRPGSSRSRPGKEEGPQSPFAKGGEAPPPASQGESLEVPTLKACAHGQRRAGQVSTAQPTQGPHSAQAPCHPVP